MSSREAGAGRVRQVKSPPAAIRRERPSLTAALSRDPLVVTLTLFMEHPHKNLLAMGKGESCGECRLPFACMWTAELA